MLEDQIKDDLSFSVVDEDDLEVLIDEYVKTIEIIGGQNRDEYFLPIFIADDLGRFAPSKFE